MRPRRKLFGNCGITQGFYRCVTSTVTITFVAAERAPRLLCAECATVGGSHYQGRPGMMIIISSISDCYYYYHWTYFEMNSRDQ